jgi:hypothetical protein
VFVCVRLCGCVWFVCLVVLYCYVAGSYPDFLLNGMKRSSPAFSREKNESGEDIFSASRPLIISRMFGTTSLILPKNQLCEAVPNRVNYLQGFSS